MADHFTSTICKLLTQIKELGNMQPWQWWHGPRAGGWRKWWAIRPWWQELHGPRATGWRRQTRAWWECWSGCGQRDLTKTITTSPHNHLRGRSHGWPGFMHVLLFDPHTMHHINVFTLTDAGCERSAGFLHYSQVPTWGTAAGGLLCSQEKFARICCKQRKMAHDETLPARMD